MNYVNISYKYIIYIYNTYICIHIEDIYKDSSCIFLLIFVIESSNKEIKTFFN